MTRVGRFLRAMCMGPAPPCGGGRPRLSPDDAAPDWRRGVSNIPRLGLGALTFFGALEDLFPRLAALSCSSFMGLALLWLCLYCRFATQFSATIKMKCVPRRNRMETWLDFFRSSSICFCFSHFLSTLNLRFQSRGRLVSILSPHLVAQSMRTEPELTLPISRKR